MKLIVETAREVPLVWFEVSVCGGSATDPVNGEGFARHMAELASRGAGARDRSQFDEALDRLGSTLTVYTGRDSFTFKGVSLSRNLEATLDLLADVLSEPAMSEAEHCKLVRESGHLIDEIRDDDNSLAERFFTRYVAPGHPYSRTAFGTSASLATFDVERTRAVYRQVVVPDNLIVGLSGDISEQRAAVLVDKLLARLPQDPPPALPNVANLHLIAGRRTFLVDKPERTQCQIHLGHAGPRYGTDEFVALSLAETVLGGSFTSRMMQEIRVKRGWSYSTGCRLGKARGAHWMRLYLAPGAEVAPAALALALELYERLGDDGVSEAELAFVKGFLAGSWTFERATARERLRLRINAAVCGWDDALIDEWPTRVAAVTAAQLSAAIEQWIRPRDVATIIVGTAAELEDRLREQDVGELTVVPYDEY